MNKILYILPGWEDSASDKQYQDLADQARDRGYEVVQKDIDWKKPLSGQVFEVPKDAVVFGFSLGAILAWLVAQKHPSQHVVLASMTPHYSFEDPEIKKALIDLAGADFVNDIIAQLKPIHQAKNQTVMYGELEGEAADILVKDTEHELSKNYISEILKLL